jgi:hypothetical protein
MTLRADGTGVSPAAANTWTGQQTFSNHVLFSPTNTYDIGQSGFANAPRDVYVARDLSVQNAISVVYGVSLTSTATIRSSGSGIIDLYNTAETGFTRLNFGGVTSSFGALARDGAGVKVIAADGTTGAFLSGVEQTAPAAPSANGYRIFAQDNGGGKTQLMVIFGSGAAQQIAIEP